MNISEHSRIWIYQSDRVFTPGETELIKERLDAFTAQWLAHGQELLAQAEIRYNQFIILGVDEQQAGATGCSIDKSVKLMLDLEKEFNISLFDRFQLAYRDGEEIRTCNREEFQELLSTGKINGDTIVFNNLVSTIKALETKWQIPMRESWHTNLFILSEV
ncbi:ABC transporter ATPase [Flavihumibacter sp. R14]|nr:ABC transporter ATPase [Flavihumibacter soli]